jgi:glutathione S-transferase
MELFFAPFACSIACRIAFIEAGAAPRYHRVDHKAKLTADGDDYRKINPKGQVPALRTDDGEILTENAAILQYIADQHPQARLVPAGFARFRMLQWLSFIGSEMHKSIFTPMFSPNSDDAARARARAAAPERFAYLDAELAGREFLAGDFSLADAYMAAVLRWADLASFDFAAWPSLAAYRERLFARPSVAEAIAEEQRLLQAA